MFNGWANFLQVIHDKFDNEEGVKHEEMPLLVYVSREKSPFYPHNFKAGALNVLVFLSKLSSSVSFCRILRYSSTYMYIINYLLLFFCSLGSLAS